MKIVKVCVAKRVEEFVREVLYFARIEEMYQEHLRRYVEELSLWFLWQSNLSWRSFGVRNTLVNLMIGSKLFHRRSHHCRDAPVS